MKQILSTLIIFIFILFIGLTLYVFEVFPFNPGGPFIGEKESSSEASLQESSQELPEFLQGDGVERARTYTEYMNRGKLLYEQGYHSLAIAEYESAAELSPSNPSPLIQIGIIHFDTEDYIKAKLNFEAALAINPENLNANIYLARTFIADRKMEDAKNTLDAIQVHNQTSKYYQALLTAYFNDHGKAKTLFYETVNIGTSASLTACAQSHLAAYDEFDSHQGGMDLHLSTLLARSTVQCSEYDLAIEILFEVLRNKKDYRDAWVILGYAYLNQEAYQDAVDALKEAQKLDPEKPQTAFFLGLGYYGLNDFDKAITYLELAKKNGYEPIIQVNQKLAEVYLQMKNYEKSAENYEEVVKLNDQDVYYYIKPIWIYIDQLKAPEKAVALANRAVASHPNHAMSYNLLGWSSVALDRLDDAQTLLDKAHALDPKLDAIYLNYGILYEKRGDKDAAIAYYKQAYKLGNNNAISDLAAERYNNLIGKSDNLDYSTLQADTLNP